MLTYLQEETQIYDLGCEEISHLVPHKQTDDDKSSFLSEISIDPDN